MSAKHEVKITCYNVDCKWVEDEFCTAYSIALHGSDKYGDANVYCDTYVHDKEKEEADRRANEEIAYHEERFDLIRKNRGLENG